MEGRGKADSKVGEVRLTSAESGLPFLAVPATTICYVEWKNDTVAFLEQCHSAANLCDDTHVLMTEDQSAFRGCTSLIHMEITTADC